LRNAILVGQAATEDRRLWQRTDLIRCYVLPRHGVLFCHLCL
jgi:hypothetical protein